MKKLLILFFFLASICANAQRQITTATAGENIASLRAVYISAVDSKVYLATATNPVAGFVITGFNTDELGQVFQSGLMPAPVESASGLTLYLSGTPGVCTTTKPSGSYQVLGSLTDGGQFLFNPAPLIEKIKGWVILGSDFTNSTVTPNDCGISFTVEASKTYVVELVGIFQAAATTTGIGLALDLPSGTVVGLVQAELAAQTAGFNAQIADAAPVSATSGARAANTNGPVSARWIVSVGVTGGTTTLKMRSEIAASLVTLKAGTALSFEKIN